MGLFGQLGEGWPSFSGVVKNLGVVDVNITESVYYVGSLVGNNGGQITNCYSTGTVAGDRCVGSLVGYNFGSITTSHSTGSVKSTSELKAGRSSTAPFGDTGGLVGYNCGDIVASYSTSIVEGIDGVGGLVGYNYDHGSIAACYSTGKVSGHNQVGGLVGCNAGSIATSYSIGMTFGNWNVGGLVGMNFVEYFGMDLYTVYGTISSSFWDIETSGLLNMCGEIYGDDAVDCNNSYGKTTTELQTASTFLKAGWDFVDETDNGNEDIWWILEGQSYPRLWWQYGQAFSSYPLDGSVNVPQPLTLSWLPGGSGSYHDVYFGEDKEAVANATIENQNLYRGRQEPEMTIFYLNTLKLEKTYYWRIDEVNQTNSDSPWKGKVWSFTIGNFIVVDDFESYNDSENQTWLSWHDGLGYGIPDTPDGYPGNGTGSAIGDETEYTSVERTIVHGGRQSVPYYYDNNKQGFAKYSEVEKTMSYPRDWTEEGVTELSLWFRGYPAAGSFIEEPFDTYTMIGSGGGIGVNSLYETDEFHFAYKELSGTGSIVAKIESIENTNEWAKSGVMIREMPYRDSTYALVCITPGNGVIFQGRRDWGGSSFVTNLTEIPVPHWIKLERDDTDNFTAFHSSDGSTWKAIGETQNIQMSANVYVGLALTSHDSKATCEAKSTNVTITGSVSPEWDHQDIGIFSNDLEPMYVAIANNTGKPAIVYHNDPGASGIDTWVEWVILLQAFTDQGIDLTDVNSIAIGFGDRNNPQPGGWGKMYFDDIRLYRPRSTVSNDSEVNVP